MGYKIPQVVKEIYLPFDDSNDDGLSLIEYKEKYGIDLEEVFNFTLIPDKGYALTPKNICKICVVNYALNSVIPLILVEDSNGCTQITLLLNGHVDDFGIVDYTEYYRIDKNKKLEYGEI